MSRSSYRSRRRFSTDAVRPLVAFLLIACFGILFAGCNGPESVEDDFVITDEDAVRMEQLEQQAREPFVEAGSGAERGSGNVVLLRAQSGSLNVDVSQVPTYNALRATADAAEGNAYVVNNEFLNMRAEPSLSASSIARLNRGDMVDVLEFVNASWAKVRITGGQEGFASVAYLARMTTDDRLAAEKKAFDGMYFVNFRFVNVRKDRNQQSEKLGEIAGQSIIRPKSVDAQWAEVTFNGKQGFVSRAYLSPFLPTFIVRQDRFQVPILQYRLGQQGMIEAMEKHVARLRRDGTTFLTFRGFEEQLRQQLQRNTRIEGNFAIVAVSGLNPQNVREASDALGRAGARASVFLETKHVGITGITEKMLLTLIANGHDVESATHTGDDLRALTNTQVELELKQSRKILEEYTHRTVSAVAYPQGGVNDRVAAVAQEAGYLFGVTESPERTFPRAQFLRLPSFEIFPSMTDDEVSKLVKGS